MKYVNAHEANEILGDKITLNLKQWQYVHESLLALQPSEYNFDETCEDLLFEFLRLSQKQFMPYACGKFLGSIKKSMLHNLWRKI